MSRFQIAAGEVLHVEVAGWNNFRDRLPHIARELAECSRLVNARVREQGAEPVLALEFC